jgi:hypothetical protein
MFETDDEREIAITLRVPRGAFVIKPPPPATVTQRTVEQHFGLSARRFRAMARDGRFPVKRIGVLLFAVYDDVYRALTEGAVTSAPHVASVEPPAPDDDLDEDLLRRLGLTRAGSRTSGDAPGTGYYRKCCWCPRPAYATKQKWMRDTWSWGGGPVCEVCARKRAKDERVVSYDGPTMTILLPVRDPTVPPEGTRRPRRTKPKT